MIALPPERQITTAASVAAYLRASVALSTWRRYGSAWRRWLWYCEAHGWQASEPTPQRVAAWIASLADQGAAWSTVCVSSAALAHVYRLHRIPDPTSDPTVRALLGGIARSTGTAPRRQARALTIDQVRQILDRIEADTLAGLRDRALVAVWWLSACRSAEVAALELADLDWREEGLALRIRRSKGDQRGAGREVAIPRGPATAALRAWCDALAQHGRSAGPLWLALDGEGARLSAPALVAILRRRAEAAGIGGVSGHSLRRGHVTAAALQGVPLPVIARQTGHRKLDTVVRYVDAARLFDETSARGLL